nr:hypothetical protein [Gammaproteobacteria bacterium]
MRKISHFLFNPAHPSGVAALNSPLQLLTKRLVLPALVREHAAHCEADHADPCLLQCDHDEEAAPGQARDLIELFMA